MEDDVMPDFVPLNTIQKFITWTEDMLCYATVKNKPHPLVLHAAATFYELVSSSQVYAGLCLYMYRTLPRMLGCSSVPSTHFRLPWYNHYRMMKWMWFVHLHIPQCYPPNHCI